MRGRREKSVLESAEAEQQVRVFQAVRKGEVLMNPDDAGVAVVFARQILGERIGLRGWRNRIVTLLVAGWFLFHLVAKLLDQEPFTVPDAATVGLLFVMLGHLFALTVGRYSVEKVRQAERLNLQVLEAHGRPVPDLPTDPEPLEPQDRARARRDQWKAGAFLAGGGVAVTLTFFIPAGPAPSMQLRLAVGALATLAVLSAVAAIVYAARAGRVTQGRLAIPVPFLEVIAACVVILFAGIILAGTLTGGW